MTAYQKDLTDKFLEENLKEQPETLALLKEKKAIWIKTVDEIVGKRVKAISGTFASFEGVVESQEGENLKVELEIFGRKNVVDAKLDEFEIQN
jgi:transcription antitermination factor NusG